MIKKLIKLANHLDSMGLFEESNILDSILSNHVKPTKIIKNACIIASGKFDDKKCLLKNRDRNYLPKVRIYHTIIDGVEIAYMKDEVTGWVEGINEFGIGVVNSALAVAADEREGKTKIIKHDDEEGDKADKEPKRKRYQKNEERMLLALSQKNLKSAVKIIDKHLGGLTGHNLVADPNNTVAIESTKETDIPKVVKLNEAKRHIRTNHGVYFPDAGYGPQDGASYYSSHARLEQATEVIKSVKLPTDIAPAIYKKRFKHLDDPMNMVRDTDNMKTTSQMVLNLTDLELLFYIIPGKVKFLGCKTDLPSDYQPKIKIKIFKFTRLDKAGNFKTEEVKSSS